MLVVHERADAEEDHAAHEAEMGVGGLARTLGEHGHRGAGRGRLVDGAPGCREHQVRGQHLGRHAPHVAHDRHVLGEVRIGRAGAQHDPDLRVDALGEEPGAALRQLPRVGAAERHEDPLRLLADLLLRDVDELAPERGVLGPRRHVPGGAVGHRVEGVHDPVRHPRARAEVLHVHHTEPGGALDQHLFLGGVEHVVHDEVGAGAGELGQILHQVGLGPVGVPVLGHQPLHEVVTVAQQEAHALIGELVGQLQAVMRVPGARRRGWP